jgi:adenylylsulfate kinase
MDNIHPEPARFLGRSARETLLNQRAKVVWLYGLSGSGKSTLASALEKLLHAQGRLTTSLDGDMLRTGLNRGLGFSDDDRRENIRRAAEVARILTHNGVITIASFITPSRALRNMARQIVGEDDFLEIYVQASFEACAQRDPKGLYTKAGSGEIKHFTGRDSSFEPPDRADLIIETESETPEQSLAKLATFVNERIRPGADD